MYDHPGEHHCSADVKYLYGQPTQGPVKIDSRASLDLLDPNKDSTESSPIQAQGDGFGNSAFYSNTPGCASLDGLVKFYQQEEL